MYATFLHTVAYLASEWSIPKHHVNWIMYNFIPQQQTIIFLYPLYSTLNHEADKVLYDRHIYKNGPNI